MKRVFTYLGIILAVTYSCQRFQEPTGSVTLTFSIEGPSTKAVTPGTTNAADGGAIAVDNDSPDLRIWIYSETVNEVTGKTVLKAYYPNNGDLKTFDSAGKRTASISFTNLLETGTYTVYAIANFDGLWELSSSPTWNAVDEDVLKDMMFTSASPRLLSLAEGKEQRIPLTATGKLIVSDNGNGELSLVLLRCVGKVTAELQNDYVSAQQLPALHNFSIRFKNINPSKGYLFPHEDDLPESATFETALSLGPQDLLEEELDADDPVVIPFYNSIENNKRHFYGFAFPSTTTRSRKYLCDISFGIDWNEDDTIDESENSDEVYEYTDLIINNELAEDITSLSRNQHLTILIRIGKGKTISFNFHVGEWGDKTQTVTFD